MHTEIIIFNFSFPNPATSPAGDVSGVGTYSSEKLQKSRGSGENGPSCGPLLRWSGGLVVMTGLLRWSGGSVVHDWTSEMPPVLSRPLISTAQGEISEAGAKLQIHPGSPRLLTGTTSGS